MTVPDGLPVDGHEKTASDVGPYDSEVIRHSEVVRRQVHHICSDLLPKSSSDIYCITDIGSDVGLTDVGDIVNISNLSPGQFVACTACCVSCALRFSPQLATA